MRVHEVIKLYKTGALNRPGAVTPGNEESWMKELFIGCREATRVRKPGKVVRHSGTGNNRNSLAPPGCRGKWGVVTRARRRRVVGRGPRVGAWANHQSSNGGAGRINIPTSAFPSLVNGSHWPSPTRNQRARDALDTDPHRSASWTSHAVGQLSPCATTKEPACLSKKRAKDRWNV